MKYIIDKTLCSHMIKEVSTNQYLAMCDSGEMAKDLCKKLNTGSGFDGETPAFFTKNIVRIEKKVA